MAVYDSTKVRQIGTMIRKLASSLETEVEPGVREASASLESLRGRTAQAMEERLEQLREQAKQLQGEYEAIAHKANTYADMLEQVDRELAEKL